MKVVTVNESQTSMLPGEGALKKARKAKGDARSKVKPCLESIATTSKSIQLLAKTFDEVFFSCEENDLACDLAKLIKGQAKALVKSAGRLLEGSVDYVSACSEEEAAKNVGGDKDLI